MSSSSNGWPVVLLHGWPVTERHWQGQVPLLRRSGFAPVPVAMPGLGRPAKNTSSFRKSDLAHWLGNELSARGLARFSLIGHDWGGTVALLLAAAMAQAVNAIVIEEEILPGIDVDIPAPGAEHYPSWHGPFNRAPGLAEQLVPGREDAYYGTFLRQSAGPPGSSRIQSAPTSTPTRPTMLWKPGSATTDPRPTTSPTFNDSERAPSTRPCSRSEDATRWAPPSRTASARSQPT